jgi:hypothetical protein
MIVEQQAAALSVAVKRRRPSSENRPRPTVELARVDDIRGCAHALDIECAALTTSCVFPFDIA